VSHVHKNIDHPIGTFLYAISTMHCMTVSLAQGGEGLARCGAEEKTRSIYQNAGFRHIQTNSAGARHPEQTVRGEEVRPVGIPLRDERKEDWRHGEISHRSAE